MEPVIVDLCDITDSDRDSTPIDDISNPDNNEDSESLISMEKDCLEVGEISSKRKRKQTFAKIDNDMTIVKQKRKQISVEEQEEAKKKKNTGHDYWWFEGLIVRFELQQAMNVMKCNSK